MKDLRLVLLAAGKGVRMRPLTETRPKPLLPILDEPLICRHVRELTSRLQPGELVVVVSYMKEMIEDVVKRCYKGRVTVVDQGEERGTGDAVRVAMEVSGPAEYLVVYSDLLLTGKAYDVISRMRPYSVLTAEAAEPWNYGVVTVSGDKLVNIVEKPPKDKVSSNLVYSGALAVDYDFLELLKKVRPSPRGEIEVTDALNELAGLADVSVARIGPGDWLDVGRPWDYLLANRLALRDALAQGRTGVRGEVHSTAVVEGEVIVEEGAEVGPYTVIEGPVYIGPGVKVGPSSHIRPETVLLSGSKVGYAVEVKASVLMEGAKAPHFNYVGDSVIGERVNLGAGTITANLRFDHRSIKVNVKGERVDTGLTKLGAIMGGYSQTGINVSLMPGVKVGSYAVIYPGCVVHRDVEEREVYKCS